MSIQGSNLASNGNISFVPGGERQTTPLTDKAKVSTQTEKSISKEDLLREIESLNKFMETRSTHLKFTLHEELNQYYVQIISDHDNSVIREIPSKKIMDMVAKMHEMIGLLVDEKR